MRTLRYHYKAFKLVFGLFSKGKYLVYFIPGILLTLVIWYFQILLSRFSGEAVLEDETLKKSIEATPDVLVFITDQFYLLVFLTVISPITYLLSNKLDTELTSVNHFTSKTEILNSILRMIFVFFIVLFFEFSFLGAWWLFSSLFNLSVINPFIYNLVGAFFYGFAFYDYNFNRYNKSTRSSFKFATNYILTMVCSGFLFILLKNIPFAGEYVIAPILTIMITTVVYLFTIKKYPKKKSSSSIEEKPEEVINEPSK